MKLYKVVKKGPVFLVDTKYGQKEKRFYDVVETSTGQEYSASMFISSKTPDVAPGDECLMDVIVDGQYTNIKRIETVDGKVAEPKAEKEEEKKEEKKEEKPTDKVPNHVWENKDRRMCRMNALTHAIKTIELANILTKELEPSSIENLVMMSADNYLTYIYEGQKPLLKDEPLTK